MHFKLENILNPLDLGGRDHVEFRLDREAGPIQVTLRKLNAQEIDKLSVAEQKYAPNFLKGISTTEIYVSESRQQKIHANKASGTAKDIARTQLIQLSSALMCVLGAIRWFRALTAATDLIRIEGGLQYSLDGETWHHFPGQGTFSTGPMGAIKKNFDEKDMEIVKNIVAARIEEPFGHELLTEAWALATTKPRSALVIAIAAIETSYKEFLEVVDPGSKWLVAGEQAPALENLLRDELPTLNVRLKLANGTVAVTQYMLDVVKKCVSLRNLLVHGKKPHIKRDTVKELVEVARDILYLLDLYSGRAWAADNICYSSKKVLREMDKQL